VKLNSHDRRTFFGWYDGVEENLERLAMPHISEARARERASYEHAHFDELKRPGETHAFAKLPVHPSSVQADQVVQRIILTSSDAAELNGYRAAKGEGKARPIVTLKAFRDLLNAARPAAEAAALKPPLPDEKALRAMKTPPVPCSRSTSLACARSASN